MATPAPAPAPLPQYLYKILPSAPPSPIPADYPLSDLDRNDGFIHFSTAAQVTPHSLTPCCLSLLTVSV